MATSNTTKTTTAATNCSNNTIINCNSDEELVLCLQVLDPILQFLTKATSNPFIPLQCLQSTVAGVGQTKLLRHLPELARRGILHLSRKDEDGHQQTLLDYDTAVTSAIESSPNSDMALMVGFPPPPKVLLSNEDDIDHKNDNNHTSNNNNNNNNEKKKKKKNTSNSCNSKGLSGCTKLAAKKRMAALRQSLKLHPYSSSSARQGDDNSLPPPFNHCIDSRIPIPFSGGSGYISDPTTETPHSSFSPSSSVLVGGISNDNEKTHREALQQLSALIQTDELPQVLLDNYKCDDPSSSSTSSSSSSWILPQQAAFAGFQEKRQLRTKFLDVAISQQIPKALVDALSLCLDNNNNNSDHSSANSSKEDEGGLVQQRHGQRRRLYCHQADAMESAFSGIPTIVCTSTGSGKSLCYLLPVLACAMTTSSSSLLIFPTKALAQDQLTKIQQILQSHKELSESIHVATIDGDTTCPATRSRVAEQCNIILTNPDTLHASILPNWKKNKYYCKLLANIRYIVLDEAHIYEGTFGTHVTLIFARLLRLCHAASLTLNNKTATPTFLASSATIEHPEMHFRLLCHIPKQIKVKVLFPSDDGSPW
jgi:DEAD/DEAH box helicase domain-containing protein